MANSYTRA